MYRCRTCGYQFQAYKKCCRIKYKIWKDYVHNRKTYKLLAQETKRSIPSIQKILDSCEPKKIFLDPGKTVLIIDTTYFKEFGVMVFRCAYRKKNLLYKFIKYETINLYLEGIQILEEHGWEILGIVFDGKRGLIQALDRFPVQMCQFHQVQIVTRYLTRRPKLQASKELKSIVMRLKETDEASFTYWVEEWHKKWEDFLKEKTFNPEIGRNSFTHKRLRSAYRSLKTNLPYLFTWERYIDLNMPNTTNSLDGSFGQLKEKLRVHHGLRIDRKIKLIKELLA